MQAKCPECGSTAFRMLRESSHATEVECLSCGHVAPFVSTVTIEPPASRSGHMLPETDIW
jgi:uncharacterized Zn finger protein